MSSDPTRLGASFRDPSGYLFQRDGRLYRQVNRAYQADFDRLLTRHTTHPSVTG